jgi:murein DD-endopeptidase MepM/ murein hydrolase activator NlpD
MMQEFDPRRPTPRIAPRVIVAAAGLAALALGWKLTAAETPKLHDKTLDPAAVASLQHAAFASAEAQPGFARPESIAVRVLPGETLQTAVVRAGVAPDEARQAVQMLASTIDTVNIKAGMAFEAAIAKPRAARGPARLIGLSMRTAPTSTLTLSRTFDGALKLHELEEKVTDETTVAQGEMEGSLYESAAKVGATPAVTAEVVKLFAHKLDFSRDIKSGDHFRMVFDRKVTESGRTVETGDLLYAELDAKGGVTRFYRFDRKEGGSDFFDEAGKNIKGFLLRTPVDGARITSLFGMRKHPVLGFTRAHQGVDFGAGTGTPIVAAGDGVVVEARRWGGYGNWIRVRHTGGWETGYAHTSRYAPGIHAGSRVRQGQVIAYVGSTGLASGPHLHYEIWFNGKRTNPIGAKVPQGTVLGGAELAAFRVQKSRIDTLLAEAGGADANTPRLAMAKVETGSGLRPAVSATGGREARLR